MKLERKGQAVSVVGQVAAPTTFNIASSRVAFNILSSGLYNDKIRAVIRELACNAYDAHVAAGKRDVPFEIHLPTSYEPFFTIKDQGTGLRFVKGGCKPCHGKGQIHNEEGEPTTCPKCDGTGDYDAVKTLYCTYFSSDKNDSNDFIGAMGLGSKSPFCYCEGFTVINRYKGVTRIYSAYISEAGTPAVVMQDETETPGVENGVEVTFPVKQNDCWEFENKARIALEFFNPKPTLNMPLDINSQTYSIRTETWGMRENRQTPQGSGLRAIQGNVQYAVGNIDDSKMTPEQRTITQLPLDIFFPIGQLAVAASRESLQLDEITQGNILKMLDSIHSTMVEEIKKKLNVCSHAWEAQVLLYSLSNQPGIGPIVKQADKEGHFKGTYKNFTIAVTTPKVNELEFKHIYISSFRNNWRASRYAKKEIVTMSKDKKLEAMQQVTSGLVKVENFDLEFPVDPEVAFVINDIKMGAEQYLHYFLQEATDNTTKTNDEGEITQQKVKRVFLFSRMNKDVILQAAVGEAKDVIAKLGYPPVIYLSELKARYESFLKARRPATVSAPTRDILELKPEVVNSTSYGYAIKGWNRAWDRSETQVAGKKFYIAVDNLAAVESGFQNAHELTTFINNIRVSGAFGIKDKTPIYGLKVASKLRENKAEWIDLIPYLMKQIPKVMTVKKQTELSLFVKEFKADISTKFLLSIAEDQPLDSDSVIQKFCDDLKTYQIADEEKAEALAAVAELGEKRGVYKPNANAIIDFGTRYTEEVIPAYPMLEIAELDTRYYYGGRSIEEKEKILLDYFRTCDKARRTVLAAVGAVAGD